MPTDPRYPIGKYEPQPFSENLRNEWLNDIKYLPQLLESVVEDLDEAQLQTPYREGGWTVHELVHHIADSHINALCRFKLALTEERPTIKPYEESEWVKLDDVKHLPINISITLLHALHARWYEAVRNLSMEQLNRSVIHPESKKEMTVWFLLGMYSWHGRHHVAHITTLKDEKGW